MPLAWRIALGVVLAALTAAAPAAAARRPPVVPPGFVGMNVDERTIASASLDRELGVMAAAGVESVRFPVYWAAAQPYAAPADVPEAQRGRFETVDGVPTTFAAPDRLVGAAARHGLRALPVVVQAPRWDRVVPQREFSPPADPAPYARFLAALARRYGTRGSFWARRPALPRLPVAGWQVWNEENGGVFWEDDDPQVQPSARLRWIPPYLALLRAVRPALRAADPRARVVLGGLVGESWESLEDLYRSDPAAGRYFDVAAIHPYTALPGNVGLLLKRSRQVMDRHGDRGKPQVATEFGWPSASGRVRAAPGYVTTRTGQARLMMTGLGLLGYFRRELRLRAAFWYVWASPDSGPSIFDYSGVRRVTGGRFRAKPALRALRLEARYLERCGRRSRRPGCRGR